ncbi:hypothetical protein [uncultured Pseudacidovorax sp.]|nr:hypothetical protein [uncultured Pseudacidovorax sp.]
MFLPTWRRSSASVMGKSSPRRAAPAMRVEAPARNSRAPTFQHH